MHNKFMHLEYPFWMEGKKYGLTMDRKGELFYWIYDQLLTRYEMERIANYMPETEALDFVNPIVKVNKPECFNILFYILTMHF